MRNHDATAERTIAESRLRSITGLSLPGGALQDPPDPPLGSGRPRLPPESPLGSGRPLDPRDSPLEPGSTPLPHDPALGPGSTPIPHDPTSRPGWAPIPPSFEAFRQAVTTRPPASLDPGKPGLRILIALAVLAAVVAGVIVWRSQPTPEPLPAPIPSPPAPSNPSPTAKVTVHITGKVHKPGLYTLAMGARVADAVTAAGGPLRGTATSSINLARRLVDGEQIVIGAPSAPTQADPATATLDLNSATPDQLEQLPGVGEVLAARIADFRTTHGGFTSIDQLREVSGIGAKKYEEIKGKVRV